MAAGKTLAPGATCLSLIFFAVLGCSANGSIVAGDVRFCVFFFLLVARAFFSPSCFRVELQMDVVQPQEVHVYTISENGAISLVSTCLFFAMRAALL